MENLCKKVKKPAPLFQKVEASHDCLLFDASTVDQARSTVYLHLNDKNHRTLAEGLIRGNVKDRRLPEQSAVPVFIVRPTP